MWAPQIIESRRELIVCLCQGRRSRTTRKNQPRKEDNPTKQPAHCGKFPSVCVCRKRQAETSSLGGESVRIVRLTLAQPADFAVQHEERDRSRVGRLATGGISLHKRAPFPSGAHRPLEQCKRATIIARKEGEGPCSGKNSHISRGATVNTEPPAGTGRGDCCARAAVWRALTRHATDDRPALTRAPSSRRPSGENQGPPSGQSVPVLAARRTSVVLVGHVS